MSIESQQSEPILGRRTREVRERIMDFVGDENLIQLRQTIPLFLHFLYDRGEDGNFDMLDNHDPRMADLILGYYLTPKSLAQLAENTGISLTYVYKLIHKGIAMLGKNSSRYQEELREFGLKKNSLAAEKRWDERRDELSAAIVKVVQTDAVKANISRAQQDRYNRPEEREASRRRANKRVEDPVELARMRNLANIRWARRKEQIDP